MDFLEWKCKVNFFSNIEFFMWIAELVQTLSGMSMSDLVITIVVVLLLKGQLSLEIKISLNSAPEQTSDNKDETK